MKIKIKINFFTEDNFYAIEDTVNKLNETLDGFKIISIETVDKGLKIWYQYEATGD